MVILLLIVAFCTFVLVQMVLEYRAETKGMAQWEEEQAAAQGSPVTYNDRGQIKYYDNT